MEFNQEQIKKHYENAEGLGKKERELLETISVRKMNNFIKTVLINEHVPEESSILDIGCGKGGDLKKFAHRNILEYVGIDISKKSIQNAEERYKSSFLRFRGRFLEADVYNRVLNLEKLFDIVSIQFSFHYAFSSEESLRTSLENIKTHLKAKGKLIATVPDSEVLLRRYKKYGNNYGNKFYSIKFTETLEEISAKECKVGTAYRFTLKDSLDDCIEYLVGMKFLKSECEKSGLKITEHTDFMTYFNTHVKKYLWLHRRMLPVRLETEELKVCELYSVLVIEKVGND